VQDAAEVKPESKGMCNEALSNIVNHEHVHILAVFCGHPQGGVMQRIYYKNITNQCAEIKKIRF
jgi:diadenosine tetraphosphate (Ap4A) HIT family hydrolase